MPPKLIRDWSSLFVAGQPLYEVTPEVAANEITPEQVLEEERQKLLDEGDFVEYKVCWKKFQPLGFMFWVCQYDMENFASLTYQKLVYLVCCYFVCP